MFDQRYLDYLKSNEWFRLREAKFKRVGRICEACGETSGPIQCHHIRYRNLYDCTTRDLVVLCEACHKKAHEEIKRLRKRTSDFSRKKTIDLIRNGPTKPKSIKPKGQSRHIKDIMQTMVEIHAMNLNDKKFGRKYEHQNKIIDTIKAALEANATY